MSVCLSESIENGRILRLTLNRPKANILDAEMIDAIKTNCKNAINNETTAIILDHNGPHFSFGASVEEHKAENAASMLSSFHDLFRILSDTNLPILAVANGQCLGGGFELYAFAHILFASSNAQFGQPEINLGVFPPMASLILAYKSPSLADLMNSSGKSISAEMAWRYGLIYEINDNPYQSALEFARINFLPKSASSVRFACSASRLNFRKKLDSDLIELEALYLDKLMKSHDANEGIHSFLDKRSAIWRHQ